jgi:hypothetical protein
MDLLPLLKRLNPPEPAPGREASFEGLWVRQFLCVLELYLFSDNSGTTANKSYVPTAGVTDMPETLAKHLAAVGAALTGIGSLPAPAEVASASSPCLVVELIIDFRYNTSAIMTHCMVT